MSQEIIKVLDYLAQQLGIAIDWSAENVWPQVLDILGRYRILQIVINSIWLTVALIALVIFICFWIKIFKAYLACTKDKQSNLWWNWSSYYGNAKSTELVFTMVLLTAIAILLITPTLIIEPGEILKWVIIPEIQYLEMLKGLMA